MHPTNHFLYVILTDCILNSGEFTSTCKSEARASPPGLPIQIIAALYLFDSEEKKKAQCDLQNYDTNIITKKNKA